MQHFVFGLCLICVHLEFTGFLNTNLLPATLTLIFYNQITNAIKLEIPLLTTSLRSDRSGAD